MAVMRFSSSAASGVKFVALPLKALYGSRNSAHIHGWKKTKNSNIKTKQQQNLHAAGFSLIFPLRHQRVPVVPPYGDQWPSVLLPEWLLYTVCMPMFCACIYGAGFLSHANRSYWLLMDIDWPPVPTAACLNGRRGQRGGDRKSLRCCRCSRRRH